MDSIERPALGIDSFLGGLYNARRDNFLPVSDFGGAAHGGTESVSWQETKLLVLCNSNTPQEKFRVVQLPDPLKASCMARWVNYEASGLFLAPSKPSAEDEVYHALHFMTSTVRTELDLSNADSRDWTEELDPLATHIVTQVLFGGCCTITATGSILDSKERAELSANYVHACTILEQTDMRSLSLATLLEVSNLVLDSRLSIKFYSDLLPSGDRSLSTVGQIRPHLERLYDLKTTGYTEAKPISYVLTPLCDVGQIQVGSENIGQLSPVHMQSILDLFDSFGQAYTSLKKHHQRLKEHRYFVRAETLVDCHSAIEDVEAAKSSFNTRFAALLDSVRAEAAEYHDVQQFIEGFSKGISSPQHFFRLISGSSGKMDLIEHLNAVGATCIRFEDLEKHVHGDRYVLYFSEAAVMDPTWNQNLDLVMHLLQTQSSMNSVVAVDCDTGGPSLERARVSEFKNGRPIVEDMVEVHEHEARLCFIKFDQGLIDATMKDVPAQHKPVNLPCPGKNCGEEPHDWVCQKCRIKVEFGTADSFLYCDCGRGPIKSASFNCQQSHGPSFTRFPPQHMQALLDKLPTPPETNILILGETGVGKSTFINAFINYLSFEKLDEALAASDLNWLIPCSFSTQSEGMNGKLVQTEVRIGQDKDEADGSKGSSATQDSTVYAIYSRLGLVRLIDTPGIGDTRGKNQDEQNFMKILRVLRNYEKLHGILVLLKPNNARLTIMFKYCIKELLTQLHKSAAQNLVFGFTNTRGSNYQPGDTFQPLETLLKDHADVIPGLFKGNVYCFDSESFRYLAARHKGIDMGNIEDYRRSWDFSVVEARRLVTNFQSKKPHEVRSTVSLNETRHLIAELIQPMARISSVIADTVGKSEKQIHDLQNTQLSGKQLQAKLTMTKMVVDSKQLDHPRTVCSNSKCCSYTTDSNHEGATITLFKMKCHDPCSLTDVPADVVGAQQIPPCAAFSGTEHCLLCKHHWTEHQHILVEYTERLETTTDPKVKEALRHNVDEASQKKMQIVALQTHIKELMDEHLMIQKSQARFSHYLQQHSMNYYNDATVEYYEHLIKDEKSKVARGGSKARLEQMEKDQATYTHFVTAMKSNKPNTLEGPLDADGVFKLIRKLYEMKHYGGNLKDCAKKTGQAYAATYRERAYRVRTGPGNHSSSKYGQSNYKPVASNSSRYKHLAQGKFSTSQAPQRPIAQQKPPTLSRKPMPPGYNSMHRSPPGSYPSPPGSYPSPPESNNGRRETYTSPSGSYTNTRGSYTDPRGSYSSPLGTYPRPPGAYPSPPVRSPDVQKDDDDDNDESFPQHDDNNNDDDDENDVKPAFRSVQTLAIRQPTPFGSINNHFHEDNNVKPAFSSVRAIETRAPASFSGVKNRFLYDDDETADDLGRLATTQSSHGNMQPSFTGGTTAGYGHAVPVMFTTGDPNNPFGPSLKHKKSKWFSSMKDKIKRVK